MYSQNNEEEIILKYFGLGFRGRFLDIGAYDGREHSNTRKLFEIGWEGVLVEPSPPQFIKLLDLYRNKGRVTLVNAAVSHTPGLELFHFSSHWASTLSEAQVARSPEHDLSTVFWINTITILQFQCWCPFHFISIDAEDRDWEICTCLTMEFLKGCSMICVEHSHRTDDEWRALFKPFGFLFHASTPENRIFTRSQTPVDSAGAKA